MSTTTPRGHGLVAAAIGVGANRKAATAIVFQGLIAGVLNTIAVQGDDGTIIGNQATALNTDNIIFNVASVYVNALGGGEIYVEEAGYNLAATWNVSVYISVRGAGWAAILNYDAGGNCITFTGDNAKVRDLKIVITAGAGAGGTRPNGIYANARTNLEISGVWCYGDVTVADDGADARQCGIVFLAVQSSLVTGNKLENCDRHGMYIEGDWTNFYNRITENECNNNTRHGLYVLSEYGALFSDNTCHHNTLSGICVNDISESTVNGNNLNNNTEHGIHIIDFYVNTVIGNSCAGNGIHGIFNDYGQHSIIAGNSLDVNGGSGIYAVNHTIYVTYIGNAISGNTVHGIFLDDTITGDAEGVVISGNTINFHGGHGIYIIAMGPINITGNNIYKNAFHGVYIYDCSAGVTVVGNICNENDRLNTGTYDGICVELNGDDVKIHSNTCNDNDRYGINIVDATCDRVWVKNNQLRGNTTGALNDAGTNTKLATIPMPFIQGTAFISADGSAKGWEINAEADMAVALGQLPLEVQQVIRLKIWAVALGAPAGAGGQMHLDILFNAGGSLEAYNLAANSWTLANFDGEEADYVNTDGIHWVVEDGDVGDEISNLLGGDSLELKVNGGTAVAPDGATNATFRVVEVEYV